MWTAAKAFTVTSDDGSGNFLFADTIGGLRNPANDGYPEESPRWYYDFAWWLTDVQDGNGAWTRNGSWNSTAANAFAILVLTRSLGGVCLIDTDQDGLCNREDNCSDTPNPEQRDTDNDGLGDVCDNCPNVPNRDQIDEDGDSIGDACDALICVEDGQPDLCDGIDNDCDGALDEAPEAMVGPCATGRPGVCAAGRQQCINGENQCVADQQETLETCDGRDEDCDGQVDEGLRNQCGRCGEQPVERCNGQDDDCDGTIDNDAICPSLDEVCSFGECRPTCADGMCPSPMYRCERGICVPACIDMDCPRGQRCNPERDACVDPCANGPECPAGERCWMGQCAPDNCITTGCPDGSICNGIECLPDVCYGIECDANEFCRDGQCIASCATVSCPFGQQCIDGQCESDRCADQRCASGEICIDGLCEADPCDGVECSSNEICQNGQCRIDPCIPIECPPGQRCVHEGRDQQQCVIDERENDESPMAMDDMNSGGDSTASSVAPERDETGGSTAMDDQSDTAGLNDVAGSPQSMPAGEATMNSTGPTDCRRRSAACSDGFTCEVNEDDIWQCVEAMTPNDVGGGMQPSVPSAESGESVGLLGCACRASGGRAAPSPFWFIGLLITLGSRRYLRRSRAA